MFLILGYRTSRNDEVPEILYFGTDAAEAARVGDTAGHPRVARLDHPIPRAIKHFDEAAAVEFAKIEANNALFQVESDDVAALALDEAIKEISELKQNLKEASAEVQKQLGFAVERLAQIEMLDAEIGRLTSSLADATKRSDEFYELSANLAVKLSAAEAQIAKLSKLSEAAEPSKVEPPASLNSSNNAIDGGAPGNAPDTGGDASVPSSGSSAGGDDEAPSILPATGGNASPSAGNQRGRRSRES